MKSKLHGIFGAVALLCIATFWLSTVVSELFLTQASVVAVKNAVLTGMWLLIPAMAATGLFAPLLRPHACLQAHHPLAASNW
mgnify:CR=1 FL=1